MDGPEVLLTPTAHPYHLFTSLVLMSHLLLLIAVSGLANRRGEGKFRLLIHGWTKTSAHVECSPISAFCLVVPYLCLICYQQLFTALLTIGGGGKLIVLIHGWTRTSAHFECSPTSSFDFIHPCLAFYYQFYQLCYQLGARVNISKSFTYGPELLLVLNAPSFLLLFRLPLSLSYLSLLVFNSFSYSCRRGKDLEIIHEQTRTSADFLPYLLFFFTFPNLSDFLLDYIVNFSLPGASHVSKILIKYLCRHAKL